MTRRVLGTALVALISAGSWCAVAGAADFAPAANHAGPQDPYGVALADRRPRARRPRSFAAYPVAGRDANAFGLALADVNGDRRLDVAVANNGTSVALGDLAVLHGDGAGGLGLRSRCGSARGPAVSCCARASRARSPDSPWP